jgi:hypothetical protein
LRWARSSPVCKSKHSLIDAQRRATELNLRRLCVLDDLPCTVLDMRDPAKSITGPLLALIALGAIVGLIVEWFRHWH